MVTFLDILILRLAHQNLFGIELLQNFSFPYFQEILLSFGEDGTFHCLLGSKIIYIFRLAETKEILG